MTWFVSNSNILNIEKRQRYIEIDTYYTCIISSIFSVALLKSFDEITCLEKFYVSFIQSKLTCILTGDSIYMYPVFDNCFPSVFLSFNWHINLKHIQFFRESKIYLFFFIHRWKWRTPNQIRLRNVVKQRVTRRRI